MYVNKKYVKKQNKKKDRAWTLHLDWLGSNWSVIGYGLSDLKHVFYVILCGFFLCNVDIKIVPLDREIEVK